ncbi:MAG: C39 family peptidase [Anaerolineae bacterium]|nr:C39 family peptidase [Anaerolineae bacterium]MDW8071377.1 C39 family peptidase [Anaerolineae bacterium]
MKGCKVWVAMVLTFLACGLCLSLVVLGSMRYGGARELLLRLRLELVSMLRRPPAPFVPTPLPTTLLTVVRRASPTPIWPTPTPPARDVSETAPTLTATPIPHMPTALPVINTRMIDLLPTQHISKKDSTQANSSPTATLWVQESFSQTAGPPRHPAPAAPSVQLSGITHIWQKWNNCGPATLAMYLSYFGISLTQAEIAAALKPNWDDKNVSPHEMADFATQYGLKALVRVNGTAERLRLLLSNGLPVMIETWLELEPNNGMGHYRLLTGYEDAQQVWIAYDSYVSIGVKANAPYQGIRLSYTEMDTLWAVFNRTYLLLFTEESAPIVASILGEEMNDRVMWERALARAQAEIASRPDDPFAHFNLGSALVALGEYDQAATAFDRARVIGLPWRMLWYQFAPFRAYYETGRYAELLALADATIATAGEIEEVYYYKGLGLAALGRQDEARQNWQHALTLNPHYKEAVAALAASAEAPSSP